jgi:hypothetical protein
MPPKDRRVTHRLLAPSRTVVRVACLVITLLLAACDGPTDTPERQATADAAAREFLARVAAADGDRGWSLVHAEDRAAWGSFDDYLAAASAADWSDFSVVGTRVQRCDDGVWCFICVDVASVAGIPAFLRSDNEMINGLSLIDGIDGCDGQFLVRLNRVFGTFEGVQFAPDDQL